MPKYFILLIALLYFSNTLYVYDIAWYSELPSATLLILDIMGCDRTRMWVIEARSSLRWNKKRNHRLTDRLTDGSHFWISWFISTDRSRYQSDWCLNLPRDWERSGQSLSTNRDSFGRIISRSFKLLRLKKYKKKIQSQRNVMHNL